MYMPNSYAKKVIYYVQCYMYVVRTECSFYQSGPLQIYVGLMVNFIQLDGSHSNLRVEY